MTRPVRKSNTDSPDSGGGENSPPADGGRRWAFLSSHAQVLLCLGRSPDLRIRDVATQIGLTERMVQLILRDLVEEGYVTCTRIGRRNRYEVHTEQPMRHPFVAHREIRTLLELLDPDPRTR